MLRAGYIQYFSILFFLKENALLTLLPSSTEHSETGAFAQRFSPVFKENYANHVYKPRRKQ